MRSLKHPHGPFRRPPITQISKDDWADIEFPHPTYSFSPGDLYRNMGHLLYEKEKERALPGRKWI